MIKDQEILKEKYDEVEDYVIDGFVHYVDCLVRPITNKYHSQTENLFFDGTTTTLTPDEIGKKITNYGACCGEIYRAVFNSEKIIPLMNEYCDKMLNVNEDPLVKGFHNDPLNFILNNISIQELNFIIENMGSDPKKCRNNLKRYNMNLNDYVWMLLQQENKCACCGKPKKDNTRAGQENGCELSIDHCHKTGLIRGLLCRDCNTQVGKVDNSGIIIVRDKISEKTKKYYDYVLNGGAPYMSKVSNNIRECRFSVPIEDVNLQLKHEKQYRFHKFSEKNKKSSNDLTQFMQ